MKTLYLNIVLQMYLKRGCDVFYDGSALVVMSESEQRHPRSIYKCASSLFLPTSAKNRL